MPVTLLRVLFQQPAIYSALSFLWLLDDVHLLKGVCKIETIYMYSINFLESLFLFILNNQGKTLLNLLSSRNTSDFMQNMGLAAHSLTEQCSVLCYSLHSAASIPLSQWDFTTDLLRAAEPRYTDCTCHCWRVDSRQAQHTPVRRLFHCVWQVCHAAVTLSSVCAVCCKERSKSAVGGSLSAQTGLALWMSSVQCSKDNVELSVRWGLGKGCINYISAYIYIYTPLYNCMVSEMSASRGDFLNTS